MAVGSSSRVCSRNVFSVRSVGLVASIVEVVYSAMRGGY